MAHISFFSRTRRIDHRRGVAKRRIATVLVAGMALALALGALSWRSPAAQASSPVVRTPLQPFGLIALEQYGGKASCPTSDTHLANAASNPAIAGLMIRVKWSDMQPASSADSSTNWCIIDNVFKLAEQSTSISQPRGETGPSAHKFVVLAFVPGFETPTWALTDPAGKLPPAATASFCIPYGVGAGTTATLPLPWDKTYHQNWSNFLQAVASRYASKTDFLMIAASGPTSISEEMSLPGAASGSTSCNESADVTTWENLCYTPTAYENAWNTTFQDFHTDFPNQYTSLALYRGLQVGNTCTADPTQKLATPTNVSSKGELNLGNKFALEANGLTSGSPGDETYNLVSSNSGGTVTGFEMATGATKPTNWATEGGPTATSGAQALQNALNAGLAANVDFLEVYYNDVDAASTDTSVQSVLQNVASQLPLPQYSPAYTPPPPPPPHCHGSTCT